MAPIRQYYHRHGHQGSRTKCMLPYPLGADPGHPERQPIFNSNYYIAENDTLEDIKNTIACVYMDIDAGLFFNKMDKYNKSTIQ